jgi:hypothetical protein
MPAPPPPRAPLNCTRVTLRGGRQPIEISRAAGIRKGLFQRETFWDALLSVVSAAAPAYAGYSYRERADRYLRDFTREELARLRAAAPLLRYTILSDQLRTQPFTQAELLVTREA